MENKIAIVGTSKNLTDNEERDARQIIAYIIHNENPSIVLSGGAKGIDSLAEDITLSLNIPFRRYASLMDNWENYKKRNLKIVEECDKLFCITTKRIITERCYHCNEEHQRTGGCWTMKKAMETRKYTRLFLIDRYV